MRDSTVLSAYYLRQLGLSVRSSDTCWYCMKTNEDRIMRSSLWGSKDTLVFWHQQQLGGDVPFHLKFMVKVTHPLWKAPTSTNICLYNVSTVTASENVQLSQILSRPRASQRAIDEVFTLP